MKRSVSKERRAVITKQYYPEVRKIYDAVVRKGVNRHYVHERVAKRVV